MASKQKKTNVSHVDAPHEHGPTPVSRKLLGALVALGALSSLWALFLWAELLVARAGGDPFCAMDGALNCQAVWDSAFASGVHKTTGMPVAGWGLIWGLVALALPLWALVDDDAGRSAGIGTAVKITALAGVVSVVILGGASLVMGHLCTGCLGTYALTLAYGAVAWIALKSLGMADVPRALVYSGGLVVVFFLVLLYPGLHTPKSLAKAGKDAMPTAAQLATKGPATAGPTPTTGGAPNPLVGGTGSGDPSRDEQLRAYLIGLEPQVQQMTANYLNDYLGATSKPMPAGRITVGDPKAPLRFVDWTDIQCPHCAQLHETLKDLSSVLPPGSFALEPRHFPLDGACNANMQKKTENSVRCYAAKAQLCMEGHAKLYDFSGALFANQAGLDVAKVKELALPYMPTAQLDACVASAETNVKLQEDIQLALQNDIQGTPLLLLNGRVVTPFPPVLFSLLMTGGQPQHPAFSVLPLPKKMPAQPGHEGHNH